MNKFIVSFAPFVRGRNDINKMYIFMATMLVFTGVYGTLFFGIQSLFLILISVAVSFLSEILYNFLTTKKFLLTDISFLVTGLIVGLTMPIKMPLYIVGVSTFIATFVVKMVFGGLGKNTFNPALVGRVFAGVFAKCLSLNLYEATINGEVYTSLSAGGSNTMQNLLYGNAVGGIGTTCIILILVAFIVLVYTGTIDWKIPVISVLSYFVIGLCLSDIETIALNMFSGSFMFVCVFMVTDPTTSPNTLLGKAIYSFVFGALSAALWLKGYFGEDTIFVVALFVDVFVPFMDKYFVFNRKQLGGYRNAHKN